MKATSETVCFHVDYEKLFRDKIIELRALRYLIGGVKGRGRGEYMFDTITRCCIMALISKQPGIFL